MRKVLRILIAPNAFKGTLTAAEAAGAMARGLRRALGAGGAGVELVEMPVADGGDGFAEVLAGALGARWHRRRVHDALGRMIWARLALTRDGGMAVIELAEASGMARVAKNNPRAALHKHGPRKNDPMAASTRGTGELIGAALDLGGAKLRRILLGIGGSATTDAGTGIARALGVRFLDARGRETAEGGAGLRLIEYIDTSKLDRRLRGGGPRRILVEVACDVANPLHGPSGAAHVFGPQKGASPGQVRQLDEGLRHLAGVVARDGGAEIGTMAGGGAAGGAGAGLAAFLGARLRNGFELVAEVIGLEEAMRKCDLVITGEGRLDHQTAQGKAPAGVLRMARKLGLPVAAICGAAGAGAEALGFDAVVVASEGQVPATKRAAAAAMARCGRDVGRWVKG